MNVDDLNIEAIKARLGSIPAAKLNVLPIAQRRLLSEDLPTLIRFYESMRSRDVRLANQYPHKHPFIY